MNRNETARTTVELTILAAKLRRRRDEWKHRADAAERTVKSLKHRVEGLEFAHKVAMNALEDASKEINELREKLANSGTPVGTCEE